MCAELPRLHIVVHAGAASANSMAMRRMSAAGTPLTFSAHSGVYGMRCSRSSSTVTLVQPSMKSASCRFSAMIAWPIARAIAPSVPGNGANHSSLAPAVFESRTSNVTSLAPFSKRPF